MKKQPKKSSKAALLPEAIAPKGMVANCDLKIAGRIRLIRGVQVMLDWDMAISLARFAERPASVYRRERARSVVEKSVNCKHGESIS